MGSPSTGAVREFALTREAWWLRMIRGAMIIGLWGLLCWYLLRSVLSPASDPGDVVEALLGLLGGVFVLLLLSFGFVHHAITARRSPDTIRFGDGWVELPGADRVEVVQIVQVRLEAGILHPKIVLELRRAGHHKRVVKTVRPHEYHAASELRRCLLALLTVDGRAAVDGRELAE